MKMIKIILVDDHRIVRDGIRSLLEGKQTMSVIGEAGDGYEMLSLVQENKPDIVLMDINLPKISGIETTRLLKKEFPEIKVLILSMYTNEDFVFNAIQAGADGYLEKNTTKLELGEAIENICQGREYFSKKITEIILKGSISRNKMGLTPEKPVKELLSARELEVLTQVVEGASNAEISERLCISIRTVETHKTHIMKKLGVSSVVELVKFALKNNLAQL